MTVSREHEEFKTYQTMQEEDYFVVFLVDARHLDYSSERTVLKGLTKSPKTYEKGQDVGHAWIYLRGKQGDKVFVLEGGQSGETGENGPKFFDGVMNAVDYGVFDPDKGDPPKGFWEPNPISYLWMDLEDGFFQKGSGDHIPTFAAMRRLDRQEFRDLWNFCTTGAYDFSSYSLVSNQCCDFVCAVGKRIGFHFNCKVEVPVAKVLEAGPYEIPMWKDPKYSKFIFSSPDHLEQELMNAVRQGKMEYALPWYFEKKGLENTRPSPLFQVFQNLKKPRSIFLNLL